MIGGDMITYRPDIQVLDATIRDGGLVNDFYFTDEFVKALYEANLKAGVDYMEFGYKASKEMFDVEKFGKWKFCDEEAIRSIVGENNTEMKISVMADVGRCDYKTDIIDRADSVIDMIRVATRNLHCRQLRLFIPGADPETDTEICGSWREIR